MIAAAQSSGTSHPSCTVPNSSGMYQHAQNSSTGIQHSSGSRPRAMPQVQRSHNLGAALALHGCPAVFACSGQGLAARAAFGQVDVAIRAHGAVVAQSIFYVIFAWASCTPRQVGRWGWRGEGGSGTARPADGLKERQQHEKNNSSRMILHLAASRRSKTSSDEATACEQWAKQLTEETGWVVLAQPATPGDARAAWRVGRRGGWESGCGWCACGHAHGGCQDAGGSFTARQQPVQCPVIPF